MPLVALADALFEGFPLHLKDSRIPPNRIWETPDVTLNNDEGRQVSLAGVYS